MKVFFMAVKILNFSQDDLYLISNKILDIAKKNGATASEVEISVSKGKTIASRMGDLENIELINCYSNEGNKWRKSKIDFLNNNILQININEKFIGERGRINCSLRDPSGFWRWLGIQFVVSEK